MITGGLVNITVVDLIDGDVLSNNNVSVGAAWAWRPTSATSTSMCSPYSFVTAARPALRKLAISR